jgi:predicted O-methyltransferase YrrM
MTLRRRLARLAARCGLLLPPEGHVSKRQLLRLYRLARQSPGPFLEVGPWVGRSTSAIAWAIRHRTTKPRFVTVEKGFASLEEWEAFWGISVYAKPPKLAARYTRHILRPGGSIASLRENLADRGLGRVVEVFVGDLLEFRSPHRFGFIYCDAAHDLAEIRRNIPTLVPLIERSHGIFVCDDIKHAAMRDAMVELLQPDAYRLYDDFFVARFGAAANA